MMVNDETQNDSSADADDIGRRSGRLAALRDAGRRYRIATAEDAAEAADDRDSEARALDEQPDALGIAVGKWSRL